MIEDMIVLREGKVRKNMDQGTNVLRIKRTEDVRVCKYRKVQYEH
jgi:hypothetical protein